MVQGEQKRGSTTDDSIDTSFDDTTDMGATARGEKIEKNKKPFRSFRTFVSDNWPSILGGIAAVIFIPLAGWVTLNVIDNSETLAVQESQINTVRDDIKELEEDLNIVRDRSLKSESLIESLEKYVYQVLGINRE